MNREKRIKHISNIASGIFSSLEGVKNQSKQIIKSKIKANLKGLNVVNKQEFEEMKAMIIKAREQNLILEEKIKDLEKKIKKL